MKLETLRDKISGAVPKSLLLGVPLFLQTVTARAETLDTNALSARGFDTEVGVSPRAMADAFQAELRTLGAAEVGEDVAHGPGPFARLIKALRSSVGKGVTFTGRKHAGTHLKSIFSMNRGAFIEKATEWANKGMHSVLLVSDDAAERLASKGIDKLDELNDMMRGRSLADVPVNETIRLRGGSTVRRSQFYGSGEKLAVTVPAKELGVTREMVGIFDARAYKSAIDDAIRAGRDPKLVDPNTFCEPAKSVDELTYVFYGQLDTGQKLVNGLLTMFPRAERVAIGGVMVAGTAGAVKAQEAPLAGSTVDARVQQIAAEHIAAFASGTGLTEEVDITSAWDRLSETGVEVGAQIAIDWGLIATFGSRVGGVLSLLLMPQTLNGGEGGYLEYQRQDMIRSMLQSEMDDIVPAMVGDIAEQLADEMKSEGYSNRACDFAEQIKPNLERAVRQNLEILLSR